MPEEGNALFTIAGLPISTHCSTRNLRFPLRQAIVEVEILDAHNDKETRDDAALPDWMNTPEMRKAMNTLLDLPNLHRVFLVELSLLDSPNPKLWLIALFLAEAAQIPAIVEKVQVHRTANLGDGADWLELLETVLVYNRQGVPVNRAACRN